MAPTSLLLLQMLLALACTPALLWAAEPDTHLHFFLHDVQSGSNPTAVQVIKGPPSSSGGNAIPGLNFGDTTVVDDALTETSSATSAAVGRAQGFYMMSSLSSPVLMVCVNLVLTTGDFNGSTIAVIGSDDVMAKERELSVVGGTGRFRMATGYVLWKTSSMSGPDATVELDVHLTTSSNGTINASAPVSPLDGGGKGAGDGSGSSGKSGAAARPVGLSGWVNACVVGVVLALVGRGW
ncbi:hypothetical protein GUJ93_ZPchr0007g5935 [Zizania palustris]|uniref:Dirigent protein n=1 Tax=Zizania palustris TaxID=103762 RepID=A0A8J5STI7_ZIZPA|nr:hypothetical protein GUJ93_ZPchr0007g5935 [Zizania palustris]